MGIEQAYHDHARRLHIPELQGESPTSLQERLWLTSIFSLKKARSLGFIMGPTTSFTELPSPALLSKDNLRGCKAYFLGM